MTERTSHASIRVAIYARVSSDRQARQQTIDSQVDALRERIAADGFSLPDELCFLDDGVSGATLMRPVLERLRDAACRRRSETLSPFSRSARAALRMAGAADR